MTDQSIGRESASDPDSMGNGAPAASSHFGRLLHDAVITAIDGRNIP
jgi:hypothetical protein